MPPLRAGRRSRAVAAIAAAIAIVAAGCSGSDGEASPEAATTSSPTPSQKVRVTKPSAPHPRTGDCHALTAAQVKHPIDTNEAVPCRKPHTTQTYHVGTFNLRIIGDRNPGTSEIAEFVTPRCAREFDRWVGGDRRTQMLSRAHPVWFVPNRRDLRLGARWFRCDVVLSGVENRLAKLPRDTRGMLDSDGALDDYGLCSRGSPERVRSATVICSRSHSWQAFDTLRVRSDKAGYPAGKELRKARNRCREQARTKLDFPLKWRYGWQAPTREQWAGGLEWGVCWVPRG